MPKSKSPAKRKTAGCSAAEADTKRVSRFQPAVGQPLHRKPKLKDLKKADGAA